MTAIDPVTNKRLGPTWLRLGLVCVVVLLVGGVFFGHGLNNMCEGYAWRHAGMREWHTHRSLSGWPPGIKCRFTFDGGDPKTYVAPWGD